MITRSPPPRRVQPAPPAPATEPDESAPQPGTLTETSDSSSNIVPTLNGSTSASASSSSFHRIRTAATAIAATAQNAFSSSPSGFAAGSGSGTPRRPEDAQAEYWKKQMTAIIAQRDDAIEKSAVINDVRTREVESLREKYTAEKRDWRELCDTVRSYLLLPHSPVRANNYMPYV